MIDTERKYEEILIAEVEEVDAGKQAALARRLLGVEPKVRGPVEEREPEGEPSGEAG